MKKHRIFDFRVAYCKDISELGKLYGRDLSSFHNTFCPNFYCVNDNGYLCSLDDLEQRFYSNYCNCLYYLYMYGVRKLLSSYVKSANCNKKSINKAIIALKQIEKIRNKQTKGK